MLRLQPPFSRCRAGLGLAALRQHRIAQRQRRGERAALAVVAQGRLLHVLTPGLAQERLDGQRQGQVVAGLLQQFVQGLRGALPGNLAAFLGPLQFGRAALGNLHPAPVLLVGAAELGLQRQEHRQVLVEIAHHPFDRRLRLRQQRLLRAGAAGIAVAGVGQQVEQAPRRMPVAHEQAAVDQRHLGHRHQHLPQQFALRRLQHAFLEHHVEQQADQIQGVGIGRVQAGAGRVQAERGADPGDLPAQALRQRAAVFADRGESGQWHGLQQRQHRQHLARRQAAPAVARARLRLRLVQQRAQRRRQYFLLVACMRVQRARGTALCRRQRRGGVPVLEEAADPVRRRLVIARAQARDGTAARTPAGQRAGARDLVQALLQLRIQLADALLQFLLADLDDRQLHLRRQHQPVQRRVHRRAHVLGAERVVVGIDALAAGDEAEEPVQPHQLRPPAVLDRAGQVAHRQAHVQFLFRDQAQVAALARQAALHRQRAPGFHCLPGLGQMRAETRGDRLALLAQQLDRLEIVVLRRPGALGHAEQRLGKHVQHLAERAGERNRHHVTDLLEQIRVAAGRQLFSVFSKGHGSVIRRRQ